MRRLPIALLAILAALVWTHGAKATTQTVYIRNDSTTAPQAVLADMLPTLQATLDNEFQAAWHVTARLKLVDPEAQLPADAWTVEIDDSGPWYGVLGLHDATDGVPYATVFAGDSVSWGVSWETVLGHELEEMLVDPYVDRAAQTARGFYIVEVC